MSNSSPPPCHTNVVTETRSMLSQRRKYRSHNNATNNNTIHHVLLVAIVVQLCRIGGSRNNPTGSVTAWITTTLTHPALGSVHHPSQHQIILTTTTTPTIKRRRSFLGVAATATNPDGSLTPSTSSARFMGLNVSSVPDENDTFRTIPNPALPAGSPSSVTAGIIPSSVALPTKNTITTPTIPNTTVNGSHTATTSGSASCTSVTAARTTGSTPPLQTKAMTTTAKRRMKLMWCTEEDRCSEVIRERVVGKRNEVILTGPATGQVVYYWGDDDTTTTAPTPTVIANDDTATDSSIPLREPCVLLVIKQGDEELLKTGADAVRQLCQAGVHVFLDPTTAAKIKYNYGVDCERMHLYETLSFPGFGSNLRHDGIQDHRQYWKQIEHSPVPAPDIICTLGGDGLLMHAAMMFQGPVPPILCVGGGSLGFLTPFTKDELVDAVLISLGKTTPGDNQKILPNYFEGEVDVFPPNMYHPSTRSLMTQQKQHNGVNGERISKVPFGMADKICLSIRMRLEVSILNPDGTVRSRYNVLNEVTVDRGISPYLAALECFCDDVHLTTVQADGVIFATPTGSTAYSMAAGSSVVHPAVPCILVTPICPHVLSFRPMIFPDHVVLRCYVPEDARSEASVAFDGKHRQELRRGDSIQVQMSPYPVPTINRVDHSADWLGNLKRNFNFNARPRQRPL